MTITYDDGTKRKAKGSDLDALKRYVSSLILQDNLRAMAEDTTYDWVAHGKALDQWNAIRLEKKAKKRRDASKPRKPVTKAGLIAFMDQYERDNGTARGWKTAAGLEFKIDRKTLKKRMAE